jgi:hypothetical protein
MSVNFGRYEFAGPFATLEELEDRPGLYAILCSDDSNYKVLDVRQAKLVQTDFARELKSNSWADFCRNKIRVAVYYSSDWNHLEQIREFVADCTADI